MSIPAIEKFLVRLYSLSSVKAEREIILRNWLMGQNDAARKKGDHCSTAALAWWTKHEGAPPTISDWARRRLCGQASRATSGRAFSEVRLIVSKKRQRLMADHVDGTRLMGWHCKDSGWGEVAKRPRCGVGLE